MPRPPTGYIQVSVRVPGDWPARMGRLAERMIRRGLKADKASVMRGALMIGLEALEEEHGLAAKTKTKR